MISKISKLGQLIQFSIWFKFHVCMSNSKKVGQMITKVGQRLSKLNLVSIITPLVEISGLY
jgi:hypothetical protein